MITQIGFALSVLLNLAIMKALQGDAEFLLKWEKRLIWLCFIVPMVLMCIPFIYRGYGPSGFNIVYPNNNRQFVYLFCGWKRDSEWYEPFFNNSLPTILLCVLSIAMTVRIYRRKRRLQREEVEFTNKENLIIRTAFIPLAMTLFWTVNVVLRAFVPDSDSAGWQWTLMVVNTSFDLLPALECIMFLVYISCSVPLKRCHFLSCRSVRQDSLLTSSDGDSEDYNN